MEHVAAKVHIFVILTNSIRTNVYDSVMRQRRYKSYDLGTGCAVEACLEVIGGKWKGVILHHLMTYGVLRFNEIQRLKPDLSPRILTAQLRELEEDGVIIRKVYPVVPPKVEYSLSPAGETLNPLIKAMQDWGDAHLVRTNAPVKKPMNGAEAPIAASPRKVSKVRPRTAVVTTVQKAEARAQF